MTSKSKRLSSIAVVATLAVVAAVALSGAAAADTTTLAGDGSDTISDFNASESDHVEYSLSSDGTDFGTDGTDTVYLNMTVNDEHVMVSNSSIASTDTSYTFNVSQDEMGTIPGDAGSNTTVTVNAWGEDTDTDTINTSVTTFDATLMFHDDYAVVYVGDSAVNDDVTGVEAETTTEEKWLGLGSEVARTNVEADDVGLGDNASGTTVHVVMANQSDEDTFETASDEEEDGEFAAFHLVSIEDHQQAVYKAEAPDELVDDYTYVETADRNGHDAYVVHVEDDYEGEDNIDIEATANGDYGALNGFFVNQQATGGALAGLAGVAGAAFLLVGRRDF